MPGVDTVDGHLSGIGALKAQQDPRQGSFPGAGFAHQRMGGAASDLKTDAVERLQRLFAQRETFADPLHANGRRGQQSVTSRRQPQRRILQVVEQLAGVRVLRTLDNRLGGALFLNLSLTKHHDPVGAFGGQRQIVGDKQHGGTRLATQDIEQVENALLHRDVESAGGLVGNNQIRLQGNGDGDQHPLFHPARQLMRILVKTLFRVAETDFSEQVKDLLSALSGGEGLMQAQDLFHLLANGFYRIERITGILRDQADAHSAQAVKAFCRPVANHFAIEDNPPGIPAGIIRQQADNGLRGGGFPRAGFSDEGQHFAALDGKADVVHHLAPFAPRAVADA